MGLTPYFNYLIKFEGNWIPELTNISFLAAVQWCGVWERVQVVMLWNSVFRRMTLDSHDISQKLGFLQSQIELGFVSSTLDLLLAHSNSFFMFQFTSGFYFLPGSFMNFSFFTKLVSYCIMSDLFHLRFDPDFTCTRFLLLLLLSD
jgi:hypothetical protein